MVASGISEALVTTQTGLTIALPGLFIVMMIQRQRQGLEARLARLESLTLSHRSSTEARRGGASHGRDVAMLDQRTKRPRSTCRR